MSEPLTPPPPLFRNARPFEGTDAEYYALPALSNSLLGYVGQPLKLWDYYHNGREQGTMRMGNAVHHALLFGPEGLVGVNRNTKEGKAAAEAAEAEGRIVLTEATYREAMAVVDAFNATPAAAQIAKAQPVYEQGWVGEWEAPDGTVWPVKGKPDIRLTAPGKPWLIDIKTTAEASREEIRREVLYRGIARQAAFYLALTGYTRYYVVMIEPSAPYQMCAGLVSATEPGKGVPLDDKGSALDSPAVNRYYDHLAELPTLLAEAARILSQPAPPDPRP